MKIYVIGGRIRHIVCTNFIEIFIEKPSFLSHLKIPPSLKFSKTVKPFYALEKPSMPHPRIHFSHCFFKDFFILVGGFNQSLLETTTMQSYDIKRDTWRSDMP